MIFLAFLIGVATTVFTIFAIHILYYRQRRSRFQTVVGIIMAVWALWCAKDLVTCLPNMYTEHVLDWIIIIDGWSAITYTIFLLEVVQPGWTTQRRLLLLALPFVLFTGAYALWPRREVILAYSAFLWCYAWGIVIMGWVKMNRYLRYVRSEYSNIDRIDASWLRPVFLFAIIGQLVWLFTSLYADVICDIVYYICIIILWLIVLHYSWNFHPIAVEKEVATAEQQAPSAASGEDNVGAASPSDARYTLPVGKLENLMEERKLYLNPTLTTKELARELNTNRTYISNYLSQQMGMTFYEYVNQLRIERAAIPLMVEHPEYKFEYVAAESGFASISTFRRAFIKMTGQTPSQYTRTLEGGVVLRASC